MSSQLDLVTCMVTEVGWKEGKFQEEKKSWREEKQRHILLK